VSIDDAKIGNPRISHAAVNVPAETFKLSERLRELAERIDKGELGRVDKGVVLLMEGRTMTTCPLRTRDPELRDMAGALISAIDAKQLIFR